MKIEKIKIKVNASYVPMTEEKQEQAVKILAEMLLIAGNTPNLPQTQKIKQPALTDVATVYILKEVQGAYP